MLLRARARLATQQGFGLIETLLSLSLLSLGALLLFAQLDAQTNAAARQVQRDTQFDAIAAVRSHADSALAQATSVGLPDSSGTAIDPLTIAGDQLIYTTPKAALNSQCRRLYYVAATQELRESVASTCAVIRPTRGPNEATTTSDGVLDGTYPSALIASHLVLSTTSQLLNYLASNDASQVVDARASRTAPHASFYADKTNLSRVSAMRLDLTADARVTGAAQGSVSRTSIRRTLRGGS